MRESRHECRAVANRAAEGREGSGVRGEGGNVEGYPGGSVARRARLAV